MRLVALLFGFGLLCSSVVGYLQFHSEQKNLQEMLAFCGTDSYWTTEVQCIQSFLASKGDLTERPDLYDVQCGGQIIGQYRCF